MDQGRRAALILIFALASFSAAYAEVPALTAPSWSQLSKHEHQILQPLSADWNSLSETQRLKWLGIAKRYPNMTAEEQERLKVRMQEWARLSPAQRENAREQYKNMKRIPPEKREALRQKWQEYESLPPEERQRLKEKAADRPSSGSMATPKHRDSWSDATEARP